MNGESATNESGSSQPLGIFRLPRRCRSIHRTGIFSPIQKEMIVSNYMGSREEWYITRAVVSESSADGNLMVEAGPIDRDDYRHGPFASREAAVDAIRVHVHDGHRGGQRWNGWGWEDCWLGDRCPANGICT